MKGILVVRIAVAGDFYEGNFNSSLNGCLMIILTGQHQQIDALKSKLLQCSNKNFYLQPVMSNVI